MMTTTANLTGLLTVKRSSSATACPVTDGSAMRMFMVTNAATMFITRSALFMWC